MKSSTTLKHSNECSENSAIIQVDAASLKSSDISSTSAINLPIIPLKYKTYVVEVYRYKFLGNTLKSKKPVYKYLKDVEMVRINYAREKHLELKCTDAELSLSSWRDFANDFLKNHFGIVVIKEHETQKEYRIHNIAEFYRIFIEHKVLLQFSEEELKFAYDLK